MLTRFCNNYLVRVQQCCQDVHYKRQPGSAAESHEVILMSSVATLGEVEHHRADQAPTLRAADVHLCVLASMNMSMSMSMSSWWQLL